MHGERELRVDGLTSCKRGEIFSSLGTRNSQLDIAAPPRLEADLRTLIVIPVFNEQQFVTRVVQEVRRYADDVLMIDDGSTDQTPALLAREPVDVIRHSHNRGYGQSLIDAFRWAQCYRYDWLISMDCDEQHEPASLPAFYRAIGADEADVISGSRYLAPHLDDDAPPPERRAINATIKDMVNKHLGLGITDAFCGYKAYRVKTLAQLKIDETGYAFPLQFWVQAAANDLRVIEVPIRLIYNDPNRSFGGRLDNAEQRLTLYEKVFFDELAKFPDKFNAVSCTRCASASEVIASESSVIIPRSASLDRVTQEERV